MIFLLGLCIPTILPLLCTSLMGGACLKLLLDSAQHLRSTCTMLYITAAESIESLHSDSLGHIQCKVLMGLKQRVHACKSLTKYEMCTIQ